MFKFGFVSRSLSENGGIDQQQQHQQEEEGMQQPHMPAFELRPCRDELGWRQNGKEGEYLHLAPGPSEGPGKALKLLKGRVNSKEAARLLRDDRVLCSDLVPGVNEGGFKLWEGAIDLCIYMAHKYKLTDEILTNPSAHRPLQGKKVLELGCGHGIPGILALLAGAEVHFQDFNEDVLRQLTIPNVMANLERLPEGSSWPSHRFFSGDWSSVGELLTNQGLGGHYDLILTAESIYNTGSQGQLLECIKQVLQPPHGLVMVAAKSYYFGVGGGVQSFVKAIKGDNLFELAHAYKTTEEVSHMVTAPGSYPKKPVSSSAVAEFKPSNGLYREVLELTFPISIQPYFL